MLKPFKTPSIVGTKDELWFVKYFYEDPENGKIKEFQVNEGINRIKDPVIKKQEITRLCEAVTEAFESGEYNLFTVTRAIAKYNSERLEEFAAIDAALGNGPLNTD